MTLPELETFFDAAKLPAGPIQLSPGQVITDPKKFVSAHLSILKNNPGKRRFMPYYDRLVAFHNFMQDEK